MGCFSVSAKCSNLVSLLGIFPRYETTMVICVLVLSHFYMLLFFNQFMISINTGSSSNLLLSNSIHAFEILLSLSSTFLTLSKLIIGLLADYLNQNILLDRIISFEHHILIYHNDMQILLHQFFFRCTHPTI